MKGVRHTGESQKRTADMRRQMCNKPGYAGGGRVKSYPDMTAGAASGPGRIEKVEKYGAKAKPGK